MRLRRHKPSYSHHPLSRRWGVGMTELRVAGSSSGDWNALETLLDDIGDSLHAVSLSDGCSSLLPVPHLLSLSSTLHRHNLALASGAWGEHLLMSAVGSKSLGQDRPNRETSQSRQHEAISRLIDECRSVGIDIIDLDLFYLPLDEVMLTSLVKSAKAAGLKCRAAVSCHCSDPEGGLASGEPSDVESVIARLQRLISSGLDMVVLSSDSFSLSDQQEEEEGILLQPPSHRSLSSSLPFASRLSPPLSSNLHSLLHSLGSSTSTSSSTTRSSGHVARRHWLPGARLAPGASAQQMVEELMEAVGSERCMFESDKLMTSNWLLHTFGERVNLSVGVEHVVPVLLARGP